MDFNKFRTQVENLVGAPTIAKNVRVLLVDRDTTSLMFLATQFEQKHYKVTTTESASVALSMFRERKGFYNIVLADYNMPEMPAFVFVQKIRRRCLTMPVLLMATDATANIATEAICRGVCFFFTKPLRDRDVTDLWQHVVRVTGKLPEPLTDTTNYYLDILRNGNLISSGNSSRGAQNGKRWNLKRNSPIRENQIRRRGKNHVPEDSSDSSESDEERENNKRPRMCWTPSLHAKFLQAMDTLGENKAYPKALLKVMNEPGLTHRQVASHLQKHRDRKRHSVTQQAVDQQALPPIKLPTPPVNNFFLGRSTAPTVNYPAALKTPSWLNAPSSVCYSLESVKQKLDALDYSANNTLNNNRGVQVQVSQGNEAGGQLAQGNGVGGQLTQGINQNHDNSNANGEQVPWFSQNFGHIAMTGDNVIDNPDPNQEQAEDFFSNFDQVNATGGHVIPYSIPNGEQATGFPQNSGQVTMAVQEPANDFEMGLFGFGNAGSFGNFGEGMSGANQQTDNALEGMAGDIDYDIGDFDQIIQDFHDVGANLWDPIN